MLLAKLKYVSCEQDNWKNGVIGDYQENYWRMEVTGENQKILIDKILCQFYGVNHDNIVFGENCDEENNTITIDFLSSDEFSICAMTERELDQFKNDEINGYINRFVFEVFQMIPYNFVKE
jgi:hypothetical protein